MSQLLDQGARVILVGDAGSGKSTSMLFLAVSRSKEFIEGKTQFLPLYISLRFLQFNSIESLWDQFDLDITELSSTPLLFLLDGLDELNLSDRSRIMGLIKRVSIQFPDSQIVIATRPAGLSPSPPDEFRFFHIEGFNKSQIVNYISRIAENQSQVEAFNSIINEVDFLQGLFQTPLLIRLLWEVFRHRSSIPTVRAELYQTVCEFLLARWDAVRGIKREQSIISPVQVNDLLTDIAFNAFTNSQFSIHTTNIRESIGKWMDIDGPQNERVDAILEQLLGSGILSQTELDSVSFIHLTFMEFYAAKKLVKTPRKLSSLLVDAGPMAKDTLLFAAGMVIDVAPIVESAVDRRELILAANCLREGRTENKILEAYVVDQLQRELGKEVINKLCGRAHDENQGEQESIYSILLRQLDEINRSNKGSNDKGKRFEEFAERFFRQTFNVVDLNRNTENGEIDLILENTGTDPFWTEWGGDIFVECKNWESSRPLKETAVFSNKVRMSRGKLGFFVSMSGFTGDAIRTLKNQVADRNAPLIVPISGNDIRSMLEYREKFDLFFRDSIRKIKHLHKW